MKTPGQVAWEAHNAESLDSPHARWDYLPDIDRRAWEAAASAALEMAAAKADADAVHGCDPYQPCSCPTGPTTAKHLAADIRAMKR